MYIIGRELTGTSQNCPLNPVTQVEQKLQPQVPLLLHSKLFYKGADIIYYTTVTILYIIHFIPMHIRTYVWHIRMLHTDWLTSGLMQTSSMGPHWQRSWPVGSPLYRLPSGDMSHWQLPSQHMPRPEYHSGSHQHSKPTQTWTSELYTAAPLFRLLYAKMCIEQIYVRMYKRNATLQTTQSVYSVLI